jgi:hypothetical protein
MELFGSTVVQSCWLVFSRWNSKAPACGNLYRVPLIAAPVAAAAAESGLLRFEIRGFAVVNGKPRTF